MASPYSTLSRKSFTLRRRSSLRSTTTPVAPLGLRFHSIFLFFFLKQKDVEETNKRNKEMVKSKKVLNINQNKILGVQYFHSSIEFGGVPCQLDQSVLYPTYKSVLGSPARRISGGSGVSGILFFLFFFDSFIFFSREMKSN
jgi:hypothetical protein